MSKKGFRQRSFAEPGCIGCDAHLDFGLSRYCAGFKNKKRRKAFRKSDPAYRAPKWCPKRKSPCEYRIYSYADAQAAALARAFAEDEISSGELAFRLRTGTGCAQKARPVLRRHCFLKMQTAQTKCRFWKARRSDKATWWRSTPDWRSFSFTAPRRTISVRHFSMSSASERPRKITRRFADG